MDNGLGSSLYVLSGLALLIVALIVVAVWMYGRQSARRRREIDRSR